MDPAPAAVRSPSEPLLLEYRAEGPGRAGRADWVFLGLGLPAVVALFVPFTYGVSPLKVFVETSRILRAGEWDTEMLIVLITVPFVMPFLLWVLRLRTILRGSATHVERAILYAAAATGAAALLLFLVTGVLNSPGGLEPQDEATVWAMAVGLAAGAVAAVVAGRRHGSDARVRVALLTPYLVGVGLCLVTFRSSRDVGWYLTALGAAAGLAELVVLLIPRPAGRATGPIVHSPVGGTPASR